MNFDVAALPRIVFGAGRLSELPRLAAGFGRRALLVTGARSFRDGPHWHPLLQSLGQAGMQCESFQVGDEPSPQLIDEAVRRFSGESIDVVIGIGGGSVLDAAKAIAGLLPFGNSVMDHLEGVGRGIPYTGPATPQIAVPTTAGTGSEATKNAVLSVRGKDGFKKSFRHDSLVPKVALLDPELLSTCPPPQMAANAMDAFVQLLESYVSLRASPFTDALALPGIEAVRTGLFDAVEGEGDAADRGRERMHYAALLSGITLAQAGLGSVHGLASPLGAFFPIPHGVVCGTLLGAATAVNIDVMRARDPDNPALNRYAHINRLLKGEHSAPKDRNGELDELVETLNGWVERLNMPRLSEYGVTEGDFGRIVANCRGGSMQTNPLVPVPYTHLTLPTKRVV